MQTTIRKRSVVIGAHKTSISLEDTFWDRLKLIASARRQSLGTLVAEIDSNRQHGNLSSAIRLYVLNYYVANAA